MHPNAGVGLVLQSCIRNGQIPIVEEENRALIYKIYFQKRLGPCFKFHLRSTSSKPCMLNFEVLLTEKFSISSHRLVFANLCQSLLIFCSHLSCGTRNKLLRTRGDSIFQGTSFRGEDKSIPVSNACIEISNKRRHVIRIRFYRIPKLIAHHVFELLSVL